MLRTIVATSFAALAALAAPQHGWAQAWPSQQVRIIVPFLPGAGNDILGRLTAEHLTPRLGQTVFVENKAGAGSQIGIDLVAKSKPDGYNLVWAASDGISILPAVKKTMPYRVPEDFSFVSRIVQLPFVLAAHPSFPAKTLAELIAYAKANPGKVRYGSSGVGGAPHMGTILLGKAAGVEMTHIPYSGISAVVNDLRAGHIDIAMITPPTIRPHTEAGTMRPLASTGKERHALFPDLPTLEESGFANLSIVVWYGILAPAGVPEPVLERLRHEVADLLKDPKVTQRLNTLGYQISYLAGDPFKEFVLKDLEQWRGVAKSANILIDF